MASTTKRSPKRTVRGRATSRKTVKGLQCPDCDFVAKHPMGLGRHRSTRHGVVSGRQRRRESAGAWVTRREAARRAGVHYNTIRHWERSGRLRRSKGGGARGALVNAADLDRLVAGTSSGGAVDLERIRALERRLEGLLAGLERLVSSARATPARGRAGSARSATRGRRRKA